MPEFSKKSKFLRIFLSFSSDCVNMLLDEIRRFSTNILLVFSAPSFIFSISSGLLGEYFLLLKKVELPATLSVGEN